MKNIGNKNELAEEILRSISFWLPTDGTVVDIGPLARMVGYNYSDAELEDIFSDMIFIE